MAGKKFKDILDRLGRNPVDTDPTVEPVELGEEKKRKVITGGEEAQKSSAERTDIRDLIMKGIQEYDTSEDQSVQGAEDKFDQYTKTETTINPDGSKTIKVVGPEPKAKVIDATEGAGQRKIFDLSKKQAESNQEQPQPELQIAAETNEEKRRREIQDVMDRYDAASRETANRSKRARVSAATLALSNPAAGQVYAQTGREYINAPTDAVKTGISASNDKITGSKRAADLAFEDSLRDPNSNESKYLKKLMTDNGFPVDPSVSGQAILQVAPNLRAKLQADTQARGQDLTYQTGEKNREVKVSEGQANRAVKVSEGQANREAAMDRTRASNAARIFVGEQTATNSMSQSGARAANEAAPSLTLSNAFGAGGKFLVRKPGLPADKKSADQVKELGFDAAKYHIAMEKFRELMAADNASRKTLFNKNWPAIKTAFELATQKNVKAMGNGVANGADIEHAVAQIGDPADIETFVRNGFLQKIDTAMDSIVREYNGVADRVGYMPSNTPADASSYVQGAGGGSRSGRAGSISPDAERSLSQEATGIPIEIQPNAVQAPFRSPNAAPQKKSVYRMVNGKLVKVSD